MLITDLSVGDIVTKCGEEHRYIVTSIKPIKGISNYETLLGPYGHPDEVWVNIIDKKVGRLDVNYIILCRNRR